MSDDTETFLDDIQTLLDDETYRFAWPTLAGIADTVQTQQVVTPRQRQAITNIMESKTRRPGKTWSRRYEGHTQETDR